MMGIYGLYKTKKRWGGCHHLLLVYDASKLSTVYVVKSPVLGLQRAIIQKNQDFFQKWKFKKMVIIKNDGHIGFI